MWNLLTALPVKAPLIALTALPVGAPLRPLPTVRVPLLAALPLPNIAKSHPTELVGEILAGRGTYMKIKSLGDAKILKLDPYFSRCYSKKIKKSFEFRT